jgi:hypothetical protein
MLKIGAMRPDYFDDRDERAIKTLGGHTALNSNAIDLAYKTFINNTNKSIKKKLEKER